MRIKIAVVLLFSMLGLAGCGADDEPKRDVADPTPAETESAARNSSRAPTLGADDACTALASTGLADIEFILALVKDPSVDLDQVAQARGIGAQFAGVGMRTTDPLGSALLSVDAEITAFIDAAYAEETVDLSALSRAGTTVVTTCEKQFVDARAAEGLQPTPAVKPKPKPKPKPATVGDGTYEVGRDIPAGTYRNGGARGDYPYCVAFASTNPNDLQTHLRGSTTKGPGIIRLNDGEFFSVQYCQAWTKD